MFFPTPKTKQELLNRAFSLAGCQIGMLAKQLKIPVPTDLKRDKGWVGMLLEYYLGANAGSKAMQDFADLGIELKTIPIDQDNKPIETTFVAVAPLLDNIGVTWQTSYVRHKLKCVLWIPIEVEPAQPLALRKIGFPVLWRPNSVEEQQLCQDWEELMDFIVLGQIEKITARYGEVLHLRPKAANGKSLTEAIGEQGQRIYTRPRGFYLRKSFTAAILARYPNGNIADKV